MLKRLTAVLLFVLLAGCGGGNSQMSLLPKGLDSAVRHARSITTTFSYTLGSANYPAGFTPPTCGSSLIAYANFGAYSSTLLSFGGGIETQISLGSCHANVGDSITVTIVSNYGEVKKSKIQGGDFYVIDNTQDSGSDVTITDNTTGHSLSTTIFFSY
jgi:hypothetical protein